MAHAASVVLGLTFIFLLGISYISLDQRLYYPSPDHTSNEVIPGLLPGVYLWGTIVVGNDSFRGYELAISSHAPIIDPDSSELELKGRLLQAAAPNHNTEACDSSNLPDLTGSIAMVKSGKCSLFAKILNCQQKGAKAVIFSGGDFTQVSTNTISIPAFIVRDDIYAHLISMEGDTAYLWTLPIDLDFSLVRLALVVIIRPLLMLTIILIIFVTNMHKHSKCLKSSPEAVKRLPTRSWKLDSPNTWQQQECSICLEDFVDGCELIVMPCEHEFHKQCVTQWLVTRRGTCPLCSQEIPSERSALLP